jgi:hypothetical protein
MDKRNKILIFGLPGSGKSYVSSFFPRVVHLDTYATVKDGKWIVKGLPLDHEIYEGTCENLEEVVYLLKPKLVLYVSADPDSLRRVNRLRMQESPDSAFSSCWKRLSTMTNGQIRADEINGMKWFRSLGSKVLMLCNDHFKDVAHGWHQW